MKRIVKLAAVALMVAGVTSVASADRHNDHGRSHGRSHHDYDHGRSCNRNGTSIGIRIGGVGLSFGSPRLNNSRSRLNNSRYSYSRSHGANYGNLRYTSAYRRGRTHATWHDTSHYDYHGPSIVRHNNHYDYIPGHYDLHRTGHWDVHRH